MSLSRNEPLLSDSTEARAGSTCPAGDDLGNLGCLSGQSSDCQVPTIAWPSTRPESATQVLAAGERGLAVQSR